MRRQLRRWMTSMRFPGPYDYRAYKEYDATGQRLVGGDRVRLVGAPEQTGTVYWIDPSVGVYMDWDGLPTLGGTHIREHAGADLQLIP